MLAFQGGSFQPHGLPEGCSGGSSSGVFVATLRDEPPSLGSIAIDVLRRLEREAREALAEAEAVGESDEQHIQYLKTVQRQCRDELASRGD